MNVITRGKSKLKSCFAKLVRAEVKRALEEMFWLPPQLIGFQNSVKEDKQSYHDHTKDPLGNLGFYRSLKDRLLKVNVPVEESDIDISDFEYWLRKFPEIGKMYEAMGDVFIEKCLEHYLTFQYLRTSNDDIYIDIAAAGSPWADILNKRGIKSYRLDLAYPQGLHGINIGTDAGDTKLPDNFATVLSLQCSYECFMGDADILFVQEAKRILNEKGRYGIVPLYLEDIHFVSSSPHCDQSKVVIESEAKRVWRDDEYKVPFGRFYSPESFKERIYSKIEGMSGKVLYFRNLDEVMRHYPGQRVYCFFMLLCNKTQRKDNV